METLPLFAADRHGFTGEERKTLKGDEVGRKKSKVEGKRETAPVLTPTAACSAGPCSSGDERRRESKEGLVRGAEGQRELEREREK